MTNNGQYEDDVTFSLSTNSGWQWGWNMDSVNDGKAIETFAPNELKFIRLWIDIPQVIDSSPLYLTGPRFSLTATSGLDGAVSTWNFDLLMSEFRNVTLDSRGEDLQLDPDSNGRLPITIKNSGNIENRYDLELELDFKFAERNLLITFHPETLEPERCEIHMNNLLKALKKLKNTNLIFTYPNADTSGRKIIKLIKTFCEDNKNAKAFVSLGQQKYFSCLRYVDAVVGNSSSGLIEVPSFGKGTINIGNRQLGRLKSLSVVDCKPNTSDILKSIDYIYSEVSVCELYIGVNKLNEIDSFLSSFGFKRVATKLTKYGWGDVLYTKRNVTIMKIYFRIVSFIMIGNTKLYRN